MTRAGGTGRAAGTGMASVESSGTTPRRASASNPADFDRNHESHRSDEPAVLNRLRELRVTRQAVLQLRDERHARHVHLHRDAWRRQELDLVRAGTARVLG